MGQVWLAEHRGLDIQVAVKFMRRGVADDPVAVARFEQEAKLAARIKSPHVVEVLDFDVTDTGIPFIVMESLRGRDLEMLLEKGRTLGVSDTARVLLQVCKALSKAHAHGIIHRDIKAENVFVVQDEETPLIKVLDFGVAKETSSAHGISLSGTTVGTPSYMSPEQLFHPKEIDLRTDLWATAVLVYRCLTGSFPFEGESFASVCLSVSKGKFATPSAINSVLPAGLDTWFKKAFHKNLDARFSSAAEMAEAFLNELRKEDLLPAWADGATEGVPSANATPPSALMPSSRTPRRARGLRRIAFMQVAAALAAIFFFKVAPPTTRAAVLDLAGLTTELTRDWAVNEGFYPRSLENIDETLAPASMRVTDELRWLPPPLPGALAERDLRSVDEVGHVVLTRHDQTRAQSLPRTLTVEFDLGAAPASTAPTASATPLVSDETPSGPTLESAPSAPKTAPATPPTDLATIRFGL